MIGKMKRKTYETIAAFFILVVLGIAMVYPLLWLFGASFKQNHAIFAESTIFPSDPTISGYIEGWKGVGRYSYSTFFKNTFAMTIPTVIGTLISSFLVAYGFSRFTFRLKSFLFALMMTTLMLPHELLIIPRYIMFRNFGWLNSYLPIIIPASFATYPFFIFMIIQFIRGIPMELDESTMIDGGNTFTILTKIIIPLSKPVIFSAVIFQFVWRWNDFFNPLIFIDSVRKYPLALALRMGIDVTDIISWNNILAMSVLSIIPPALIYFCAQNYFVEGIATTGLKG